MLHFGQLTTYTHTTNDHKLEDQLRDIFSTRLRFCKDCEKIAPDMYTELRKSEDKANIYRYNQPIKGFRWMINEQLFDSILKYNDMICLCCFAKRFPSRIFTFSDFPPKFHLNLSKKRRCELADYANKRENDNPNW